MISSLSRRRTGVASPADARSAERTAKPSTLERSNGGTSIGATTSAASAQTERIGKRPRFAWSGAWKQRGLEPRQRVLARQDGQELILLDAVAAFRLESCGSSRKLLVSPVAYRHRPRVPAANPSLPPGTASHASARTMVCSDRSPIANGIQASSVLLEQQRFQQCRRSMLSCAPAADVTGRRGAVRTIDPARAAPASTTPPAPDPARRAAR